MHQTIKRPQDQRLPPALNIVTLATFSAALCACGIARADLTGTTKLDGKAPEPEKIDMSAVGDCVSPAAQSNRRIEHASEPSRVAGLSAGSVADVES